MAQHAWVLVAAGVLAAASRQSRTLVTLACPDDYTQLGTNCYMISETPLRGADAPDFCDNRSGTVAVIESEEELNLLKDWYSGAKVYLGINLLDIRKILFEFALKLSGHTGFVSLKPGGEDCLVADSAGNWSMAGVHCSRSHRVLCKAPVEVLPAEGLPAEELPTGRQCPPGTSQFDNSTCFWYSSKRRRYARAAAVCRNRGMSLASVHSQEENDFIYHMATEYAWIGLADEDGTNAFEWVDGTALGYVNWGRGQPNNGGDEACVRLTRDSGRWYDAGCTELSGVVCRGAPDYID